VYAQISCWRFFLGAGVGGEYPLAATVTSESTSAARRGALMAAVFSMQGVGALLSVTVVIVCLSVGMSNAFTWRFALAFGAMPALVAFPWRLRMHETETFERVKQERLEKSR
jgi:PHS family inorganic phosphate transporter-like MFS transporter